LKKNGTVLLNTSLTAEELASDLPENFKQHLKETNARLFIIPAMKVAKAAGMKNRINTIMQSCFFKISGIIDYAVAEKMMKDFVVKSYSKKGDAVVASNMKAIDAATNDLIEVDTNKIINTPTIVKKDDRQTSKYYEEFISFIEKRRGDSMPVSCFQPDGAIPTGTSKFEKRGISQNVPK